MPCIFNRNKKMTPDDHFNDVELKRYKELSRSHKDLNYVIRYPAEIGYTILVYDGDNFLEDITDYGSIERF